MSNFFGLDDQITGDIRLNGIGWIGAMLVVGLSILAAGFVRKALAQLRADHRHIRLLRLKHPGAERPCR
jgi:hypothetical protein